MMYDTSKGGTIFRKYNSVNLGWWHTYKHAALKVWQVFGHSIMAPLWHNLYPNSQFHLKAGLPSILHQLVQLHVSYPHVKDRLDATLQQADLQPRLRNAALDIQFMFEFAIPTVCFVHGVGGG